MLDAELGGQLFIVQPFCFRSASTRRPNSFRNEDTSAMATESSCVTNGEECTGRSGDGLDSIIVLHIPE